MITTTDYDTWNRPKKVTIQKPGDPLILTESYTYDASGRVRTVIRDRDGGDVTTRYEYDDMGRRTLVSTNQIATVSSMSTSTTYNIAAKKIVTESPGGSTTTVDLDSLGRVKRSVTSTGASPIEQRFAYDLAGNQVYATDMLTASASAFDVHGRAIGVMHADGTITSTEYDGMSRPKKVKSLADDRTEVVGQTEFDFTDAGRMKSMTTRVDGVQQRATSFVWDGGGRTTGVATSGRASRSKFDVAGRMLQHSAGSGSTMNITELFNSTHLSSYDGGLPQVATSTERGGSAYTSTAKHDTTGMATENTVGPLTWTQRYDQLGNVKTASVPERPETHWKTDARGAVERETLPGGATNQYAYHLSGAQASYTDPSLEATFTVNDLLGRPTRRDYFDATFDVIEWEGARLKSFTDRQGRKQTYRYNPKGQLDQILEGPSTVVDDLDYDRAGRLKSWKNADSELTWSEFDLEGRPKRTTQKRFRNASGFSSQDELDRFEQTHTYNEHGERTGFSMPAYSGLTFGPGWTSAISQTYDAMGNLESVSRGGVPLMMAAYRNAGRPQTRTVTTAGGAAILRTYGYDAGSSLMNQMAVEAGGVVVAGSHVTRDGLQLSSAQLLGVSSGERFIHWRYDQRSRLSASISGATARADPSAAVPGRAEESLTPADFRTAQLRESRFDAPAAAALQARGVDTTSIDPPTATFEERAGHKIAKVTEGPRVRPFGWNGAERVDDGRYLYEFDSKGRLIRATEKASVPPVRRIVYAYSGTGRVIGRRAEYTAVASPMPTDWKLEDRANVLSADGRPAETTLVWDPISDNLLAVFKSGPTAADTNGGLLKQVLHGGAAYDDPIETTTVNASGAVTHLYPVYDEAGAGSMQIVINDAGEVVARTLPNDPYGGEDINFTGAAIDGASVTMKKNAGGAIEQVEVTIHATEQLEPSSVATGGRLAVVDATGQLVRSATATPTLVAGDPFAIRWTLTAAEWSALTSPTPVTIGGVARTPTALSVAATNALRAVAWNLGVPILPAPAWATASTSVHSSPALPVEVREPLSSLTTFTTTLAPSEQKTATIYAVDNLALLGSAGAGSLIEDTLSATFQALPFSEPATGLVYARARWYDPGTGSFLTPDPLGYIDSSNLYAFAGGDPVNFSDPTGECLGFGDGTCADFANAAKKKLDKVRLLVDKHSGSTVVDTAVNAQVGFALDVVDTFLFDPLRVGDATGTAIGSGASVGAIAMAVVQDVGRAAAVAGGAGTVIKTGVRGVSAAGRGITALRAASRLDDVGVGGVSALSDAQLTQLARVPRVAMNQIGGEGAELAAQRIAGDLGETIIETQFQRGAAPRGFDFLSFTGRGFEARLFINEVKLEAGRVGSRRFTTFGLGRSGMRTFDEAMRVAQQRIASSGVDFATQQALLGHLRGGTANIRLIGGRNTIFDPQINQVIGSRTGFIIGQGFTLP